MNRSATEVRTRKRPELGIQPPEDLGGQVVEDEALGAGEGIDDADGGGLVTQRDRGKLEARNPALRALDEASDVLVVELESGPVGEIARGLVGREPQVVRADLDQASVGAESWQRERRVLARDDDEVDEGWPLFDESTEQGMHGSRRDDVVVVEDEHERVVRRGDGVDQERGAVGARTALDQRGGHAADPRAHREQRADEVTKEAHRVVVRLVQREPRVRDAARSQPARHRNALAVPGRSRQERQAGDVIEGAVEARTQAGAVAVCGDTRGVELGRDERGRAGRSIRARSRPQRRFNALRQDHDVHTSGQ